MRKVVSIAVFGESEKYSQYLPAFVRGHLNLFPQSEGWELHVHVDETVLNGNHSSFLWKLYESDLIDLQIIWGHALLTRAMLWRMVPVFESGVDYVFCRDIDACPAPRDRRCCDEFIASGCDVHTVHDNVMHTGIMGGLCGFRTEGFRRATGLDSLDALYRLAGRSDEEWAQHGTDQNVLNWLLLRQGGPRLLEHRFAGWEAGQAGRQRPREASVYPNEAWSTSVPDSGTSHLFASDGVEADRLAAHLGSAGYDHVAACRFWDEHGDPEVTRLVRECEEAK